MSRPLRPKQGDTLTVLQAPNPQQNFPQIKQCKDLKIKCKEWLLEHLSHEPSSLLTAFNTEKDRYRFLKMPFGLKISQDVFQMRKGPAY